MTDKGPYIVSVQMYMFGEYQGVDFYKGCRSMSGVVRPYDNL